jgi:hypothetical protein
MAFLPGSGYRGACTAEFVVEVQISRIAAK